MCKKSGADLEKSRLGIMYFHHMTILLPITKRHEQQIKSYHRYQKAIIQISSFMKFANTIKEKKSVETITTIKDVSTPSVRSSSNMPLPGLSSAI